MGTYLDRFNFHLKKVHFTALILVSISLISLPAFSSGEGGIRSSDGESAEDINTSLETDLTFALQKLEISDDRCGICWEEFKNRDTVCKFKCRNNRTLCDFPMHEKCLSELIQGGNGVFSCTLCRRSCPQVIVKEIVDQNIKEPSEDIREKYSQYSGYVEDFTEVTDRRVRGYRVFHLENDPPTDVWTEPLKVPKNRFPGPYVYHSWSARLDYDDFISECIALNPFEEQADILNEVEKGGRPIRGCYPPTFPDFLRFTAARTVNQKFIRTNIQEFEQFFHFVKVKKSSLADEYVLPHTMGSFVNGEYHWKYGEFKWHRSKGEGNPAVCRCVGEPWPDYIDPLEGLR